MLYAKSTGGFYDPAINKIIPVDAIEIPSEEYALLMAAQSGGKTIQADAKGSPVAIDTPPSNTATLWRQYQAQAQLALDKSDVTILRCVESSAPVPIEWVDYRKALRAIATAEKGDASQPFPPRPTYPSGT